MVLSLSFWLWFFLLYLFLGVWFLWGIRYARLVFSFSRSKGVPIHRSLRYAFTAFFHYPTFLWDIRLRLSCTEEEKRAFLHASQQITGVTMPSSFLCPFCKVEIRSALCTASDQAITVQKTPLLCPRCKTQLDGCRYCLFFEPERGSFGGTLEAGKCTRIKRVQPVEEICSPWIAQRLKEMGWHTLHAGIPITDSFSRPERCRFFQFDETKTRLDRIPCMGKTRFLLLKLEEELYSHSSSGSRSV